MKEKDLREIESLLRKAGEAVMAVYESSNYGKTIKLDFSPVTRADHASSRIINEGLAKLFPGIPVVDEENPIPLYSERKFWKEYFLLDPLDGTKEFLKKNGEFCINLALMKCDQPVASWIYKPVGAMGWSCVKGEGIRKFDSDKSIETEVNLNPEQLVLITSRSHTSRRGNRFMKLLGNRYTLKVIKMGSALKQVEVALGKADLYIRGSGCSEWDTAAGHLMVTESGGHVFQWDLKNPLLYNKITLTNPPFLMMSKKLQQTDFLDFIENILADMRRY